MATYQVCYYNYQGTGQQRCVEESAQAFVTKLQQDLGQTLINEPGDTSTDGTTGVGNFTLLDSELLREIFSTPGEDEIRAAFMAGITIPLIVYLAAWAFQQVINMFTKDR